MGRCGDCCLLIAQNWDKVQQYISELETGDKCDLEIRQALQDESHDCTQDGNVWVYVHVVEFCHEIVVLLKKIIIDFNLIPSHLNSKEDLLNVAANCYRRSLELETNERNINNLNRRIGNVYNEITSEYIDEIASELNLCFKKCLTFLTKFLFQKMSDFFDKISCCV